MANNACYNCTERSLGCHGTCVRYAEFRSDRDKILHEKWMLNKEKDEVKRVRRKNMLGTHKCRVINIQS